MSFAACSQLVRDWEKAAKFWGDRSDHMRDAGHPERAHDALTESLVLGYCAMELRRAMGYGPRDEIHE